MTNDTLNVLVLEVIFILNLKTKYVYHIHNWKNDDKSQLMKEACNHEIVTFHYLK
jgi:hypothetical protein